MRTRRVTALLLSAVALGGVSQAGCGQPANRPADSAPAASAPAAAPPAPAPLAPPPPPITGAFDAISTTAMGIAGDLTMTDRALTFTRGITYATESAGAVSASTAYGKEAGSWAALLGVPLEASVELRRVTGEKVGPRATNGSLCGKEKTTFLALAQGGELPETTAVKIAAFSGATMPGPQAHATDLCGTFTYERKR